MVVIQHTVKDASGNKLATIEVKNLEDLKEIAKALVRDTEMTNDQLPAQDKHELKKSPGVEYVNLEYICASDDNKSIVFQYTDAGKITFNLVNHEVYHNDGKKLLKTHYDRVHGPAGRMAGRVLDGDKHKWVKSLCEVIDAYTGRWLSRVSKIGSVLLSIKAWDELNLFERIAKAGLKANAFYSYGRHYLDTTAKTIPGLLNLDQWFVDRLTQNDDMYNYLQWYINQKNIVVTSDRSSKDIDITKNIMAVFQHVYDNYERHPEVSVISIIGELVTSAGYNLQRLCEYVYVDLIYQGINPGSAYNNEVGALKDYVTMCRDMKKNDYDRYPKYLKTYHDIVVKNYNAYRDNRTAAIFGEKIYPELQKLEFSKKGYPYLVLAPQSPKDIVREGNDQHHCVASYVDRVVEGRTCIMFMRLGETPGTSLITLEVKDMTIIQAKGQSNRPPTKEEQEFLDHYKKFLATGGKKDEGIDIPVLEDVNVLQAV